MKILGSSCYIHCNFMKVVVAKIEVVSQEKVLFFVNNIAIVITTVAHEHTTMVVDRIERHLEPSI